MAAKSAVTQSQTGEAGIEMDKVITAATAGVTGTGAMVVGQGGVELNIPATIASKPSVLSIDLLNDAYSHAFTIGDLMTAIGFSLTVLAVYIAFKKHRKHNQREGDYMKPKNLGKIATDPTDV